MKTIHLILAVFILASCSQNNDTELNTNDVDTIEAVDNEIIYEDDVLAQIARQWVMVKRTNMEGDKTLDFNLDDALIITDFESNGYFTIYDLIKKEETHEGTLKKRSYGQWEVYNTDELVMRHSLRDTANIDAFVILKINEDTLILKNSEKDFIDTYQIKK